jgi:hypothetical protein
MSLGTAITIDTIRDKAGDILSLTNPLSLDPFRNNLKTL